MFFLRNRNGASILDVIEHGSKKADIEVLERKQNGRKSWKCQSKSDRSLTATMSKVGKFTRENWVTNNF